MMEEYLRRAILIAKGDATVFVTRLISLTFIIITAIIMVVMVPAVKRWGSYGVAAWDGLSSCERNAVEGRMQ